MKTLIIVVLATCLIAASSFNLRLHSHYEYTPLQFNHLTWDAKCFQTGEQGCAEKFLKPVFQASTNKQALGQKLKEQIEGIQKVQATWNDKTPWATIHAYFSKLTSDPDTGKYWGCVEGTLKHCAGRDNDKLEMIELPESHFDFAHLKFDAKCFQTGEQGCAEKFLKPVFQASKNRQALGQKLKGQIEGIQKVQATWNEKTPWATIHTYFAKLTSDPDTGKYWGCVEGTLKHCAGRDNDK